MTVFVPQEVLYKNSLGALVPKFQTHKAEEYGRLEVLLPYGKVMLSPQPMISRLRRALKDFSDDDYILPTGDPAAIAAATSIAADMNRGRVKLLRWDGGARRYIELKMNLKGNHYD